MAGELKESYVLQWYSIGLNQWMDFTTYKTKEELLKDYNRQVEIDGSCQYQAVYRLEKVIAGQQP